MRAVLEGYQGRYSALVDAVTETESTFDDERLGSRRRDRSAGRAGLRARRALARAPRRIVGIGTDLVEVPRFALALQRRPTLADRLFSDAEREYAYRFRDPTKSLAARFGAKEAVMKAMGVGLWKFAFRDVEVVRLRERRAHARALQQGARARRTSAGCTEWHLSLTHTDSMAMAVALAVG